MIVVALIAAACFAGVLGLVALFAIAPEGFEDSEGFHLGPEPFDHDGRIR